MVLARDNPTLMEHTMILPCGHTRAEHDALLNHHAIHARDDLIGWIRRCQRNDPADWPEALAVMADLIACDLPGDERVQVWTERALRWSDEVLVVLVALSAAACHAAGVRRTVLAREGRRLTAPLAADLLALAMARHEGRDGLDDLLAEGINVLTDWEALNVVHFGRSALMTIGLGAPDLLALVDMPDHNASGE